MALGTMKDSQVLEQMQKDIHSLGYAVLRDIAAAHIEELTNKLSIRNQLYNIDMDFNDNQISFFTVINNDKWGFDINLSTSEYTAYIDDDSRSVYREYNHSLEVREVDDGYIIKYGDREVMYNEQWYYEVQGVLSILRHISSNLNNILYLGIQEAVVKAGLKYKI